MTDHCPGIRGCELSLDHGHLVPDRQGKMDAVMKWEEEWVVTKSIDALVLTLAGGCDHHHHLTHTHTLISSMYWHLNLAILRC